MDSCKEWLEDLLRDKSAGVKVSELLEIGYEEGFSRPTIFRARRELQSHIRNTHGRKSPDNSWQWSDQPLQPTDEDE